MELGEAVVYELPINEAELRESDKVLNHAVSFAVAPGEGAESEKALDFSPLDFNRTLLASPIFPYLLAED